VKRASPSLRRQLIVRMLATMAPLFVLLWGVAYFSTQYFINAAFDRSLARRTYALADQVEVVHGRAQVNLPVAAREMLVFDQEDLLFHRVLDPAGRVIEGERRMPPLPKGQALRPGQLVVYDGARDGEPVRVAAFGLSLAGTSAHGTVLIQVGETLSRRKTTAQRATLAIVVPMILTTLAAALVIAYGVRRGLGPLERLRDRLAARQAFDLSPVPQEGAPAELRPFLDEINSLLQRLAEAVEAQSRFVADAAHQLRTPIAGIRAQAEAALAGGGDARHALSRIAEAARTMGELVQKLLVLARVEAAGNTLRLTLLDGAGVARDCARDWAPRALARGVEIGFDRRPGDAALMGDAQLLKEMLGNLIDNALRYGATHIAVAAGGTAQGACWRVTDDGPGIPAAQRADVFAPFHRLSDGVEGAGLGLTIVQRIAALHGATLALGDSGPDGGLSVEIRFPPPRDAA
jgi:two-component system sensor histidine kinase TctE